MMNECGILDENKLGIPIKLTILKFGLFVLHD
jgi:hypothetical protein